MKSVEYLGVTFNSYNGKFGKSPVSLEKITTFESNQFNRAIFGIYQLSLYLHFIYEDGL